MKLTEVLGQWLGLRMFVHPSDSYGRITSKHQPRWRQICENLGEEVSPEAVEFLAGRGLSERQIEEFLCATNTLGCPSLDNLDVQVDRLFAESTLKKYGYQGVEQFMQELIHRRETKN